MHDRSAQCLSCNRGLSSALQRPEFNPTLLMPDLSFIVFVDPAALNSQEGITIAPRVPRYPPASSSWWFHLVKLDSIKSPDECWCNSMNLIMDGILISQLGARRSEVKPCGPAGPTWVSYLFTIKVAADFWGGSG